MQMSNVIEQGRAGNLSEKGSELGMHLYHSNFNIFDSCYMLLHARCSILHWHTSLSTILLSSQMQPVRMDHSFVSRLTLVVQGSYAGHTSMFG